MSAPDLAVDFQWMVRGSSPGMYSRMAWKAMSAGDRSVVACPSRSRTRPVLVDGIAIVRGCTMTCSRAVQTSSRRTSPTGSARTPVTGPTSSTPRRSVGTGTSRSKVPCGPMAGIATSTRPDPTGTSTVVGTDGKRVGFSAVMITPASSPTATRCCGSRIRIASRDRPINATAATTASTAPANPTTTISRKPNR
ncbi:hypothetical protein WDV91_10920 [Curtobacterium flaccumfaciens pv. flaccumfaciens]